jgi:hypothetical protein
MFGILEKKGGRIRYRSHPFFDFRKGPNFTDNSIVTCDFDEFFERFSGPRSRFEDHNLLL